jgi:hypothetical protein
MSVCKMRVFEMVGNPQGCVFPQVVIVERERGANPQNETGGPGSPGDVSL